MELIGFIPVYKWYLKLRPLVTPIKKRKQGSSDPDNRWYKARLRQNLQLLIRYGKIEEDDPILDEFKVNGVLPDYSTKSKLTKVDEHKVGHWDETHSKCTIGDRGSRENSNVC